MTDLIDRLNAALDEDERIARAAADSSRHFNPRWHVEGADRPQVLDQNDAVICDDASWSGMAQEDADHIARHDPARVLRQVEGARKLLDAHAPQWTHVQWWDAPETGMGNICTSCAAREPNEWELGVGNYGVKPEGWVDDYILWPCPTILALAEMFGVEP